MQIALAEIYCFGLQSKSYVYKCELVDGEKLNIEHLGSIVEILFSKKNIKGIVLNINTHKIDDKHNVVFQNKSINIDKIKPINKIIHKNFLPNNLLSFLKQMAFYNVIEIERLIQMSIPSFWINKKREIEPTIIKNRLNKRTAKPIHLSKEQNDIADKIYQKNGFNVSVLRGIMGSGKTYVFLDIIKKYYQKTIAARF